MQKFLTMRDLLVAEGMDADSADRDEDDRIRLPLREAGALKQHDRVIVRGPGGSQVRVDVLPDGQRRGREIE